MFHRHFVAILATAALLAPLAAAAGNANVEVAHGTFEPDRVKIAAGESVTFTNAVAMPGGHTVTFEELGVDSGALGQGESWSHTFEKPGTYHFHVAEHPENKGKVVVKE